MSDRFNIITSFKNSNPDPDSLYIKAYQLIRDNEKNRTVLGLSIFNASSEDIANVGITLSYSTPTGKVKKIIPIDFPEDNIGRAVSKNLPIDEKELSDFNVELTDITLKSELNKLQTLAKEEEKKKPNKKFITGIISAVAVILIAAAVVLLVFPEKNGNDAQGIKNITGKGDGNFNIEITTEEASREITFDNTQIALAKGITDIKAGELTTEPMPESLSSFIKGNFCFTGSIYSVSLAKADEVVLAISPNGYYYRQPTNGKELAQSKINGKCYYINPETKEYITVTNDVMTKLNKKEDDFNLKIFNTSMQKNYELHSAVIQGKNGLFLRVNYLDGYYDDVYCLDGKIVEINTYNSENKLTECLLPKEFTGIIPEEFMNIDSYTATEDFDTFFEPYL